ncbi:hypothetical protein GCM10011611_24980 [Aliidongia dinghuensis]|uniref:Uncharacterized protein n=1 Tax=Aliidongia dinghuensis TaxID=1867774 RepID=A0A8J2YT55_9PROT|nr:hypothetical protein [Aliidongia dinghuensis]GGF18125.1 hypothetical protein GCM10011611_24980 [Aliidongia dinghuensis]
MAVNEQSTLQARVEAALARLRAGAPLDEKNIRVFEAAHHHCEPVTINVSMLAREADCSRTTLYDRCSHLLALIGAPDGTPRTPPKAAEAKDEDVETLAARLQVELAAERAALAEVRSEWADSRRELKLKSKQLRNAQAVIHVLQQAVIELNNQVANLNASRQVLIDRNRKRKPMPGDGSPQILSLDGRHEP